MPNFDFHNIQAYEDALDSGLIGEDVKFREARNDQKIGKSLDQPGSVELANNRDKRDVTGDKQLKRTIVIDQSPDVAMEISVARAKRFSDVIDRSRQLTSKTLPSVGVSEGTIHYLMYKSPWAAIRNYEPLEHALQKRSVDEHMTTKPEGNALFE